MLIINKDEAGAASEAYDSVGHIFRRIPLVSWDTHRLLCFTQTSFTLCSPGGQPPQLNSQWTGPVTSCPSWLCWGPVQTGMWVCLLRTCVPRSVAGPRKWSRTWSLGMQALTVAWHMRSVITFWYLLCCIVTSVICYQTCILTWHPHSVSRVLVMYNS